MSDSYDSEEGFLVEIEDIAIVCHEAVCAYRKTQGAHSTPGWMYLPETAKRALVARVSKLITDPAGVKDEDTESRLYAAIVQALRTF